jgi:outer membrane protein assembly factor BamB
VVAFAVTLAALSAGLLGTFAPAFARTVAGVTPGLSVSSGPPGTHIFITGTGFKPNESVQPTWLNATTTIVEKSFYLFNPIVTADMNGNVSTSIWAPSIGNGSYTITLKGLTSGTTQSFPFTLVPSLDLGITIGPPGTELRFHGWGFGIQEVVDLYWGWSPSNLGTLVTTASTDSKGSFGNRYYDVHNGTANGTYTVAAVGKTSGVVATAQFTVGIFTPGANPGTTDWSTFGFDLQQTRVNPYETTITPKNVNKLALKWQGMPSVASKTVGSPTIANGIAYIGTVEGYVTAYNLTTHQTLWRFAAPGPIYGSPVIANGIAYFGTVNYPAEGLVGNYAFALNAQTGALLWDNYLVNGGEWVSPVVANGMVYFPEALREGVSGGFIAFNPLTGATIWSLATPYGIWAPVSLDPTGKNLYVPTGNPCVDNTPPPTPDTCSGYILDLNPMTGTTIWSYHFPDLSGDDDAPAAPLYYQGYLYMGLKNGHFYKINASNGVIQWNYNTGASGDSGIYSSAAFINNMVVFGGGDRKVHALKIANGGLVWAYPSGSMVTASPSVADGVIYVGSLNGTLSALNPANGALFWSYNTGSPVWSSSAIVNGTLYQSTGTGALDAFTLGGA